MKSLIYLIRHGITEGNQKKWYYGATNLPLADEGRAELRHIAETNPYPNEDDFEFYSSGLIRADETLTILFGDRDRKAIDNLQEMNFGEFECFSYADLMDRSDFQLWVNDVTWDISTPGGESRNQFKERIKRGTEELLGYHRLKELSHRHSGKAAVSVVVCHGGVIATMLNNLFQVEDMTWWDLIPKPGSGYLLKLEDGKPREFQVLDHTPQK